MYKLLLWIVLIYVMFVVVSCEVSNSTSSAESSNLDDVEGRRRKFKRIWCKFLKDQKKKVFNVLCWEKF